jgi:hypothetical protein
VTEPDIKGLVLRCECGVRNYLDPYAFFNFSGKTRCAGCGQVYLITLEGGFVTEGPSKTDGEPDRLPGYAEAAGFEPISGPGKTAPSPKARADILGRPKPITQSIRGRPVSGRPLTRDELVGSRPRMIVES